MDPPKYSVGTLVLSNLPYRYGAHKDRYIGWIIHIYEKAVPYTRVSVYYYVVQWNDFKIPSSHTENEIDLFVNNLKNAIK